MRDAILITRPEPAASALASQLALRGLVAIGAPVFTLQARATPLPDCADGVGVIFTSANAVRLLPYGQLPKCWERWACYCVGAATAVVAAQAGWQQPISADGDGAALAALILAQQPDRQVWLHPCGAERRAEPAVTLRAQGHEVLDWEVYDAAAVTALPTKAIAALREQDCAAALFYSSRSVEIFAALLRAAGLDRTVATMTAWCLSPQVAAVAAALPWRAVLTAPSPDEAALLSGLQNWLRQEKMPPNLA